MVLGQAQVLRCKEPNLKIGLFYLYDNTIKKRGGTNRNRALYSDNHGKTWKIGKAASTGGEFEIAESSLDTLIYTLRSGKGQRKKKLGA